MQEYQLNSLEMYNSSFKLSIITINLNNAEGLFKTIESVKSQTRKEFEHIVIDGLSVDSSIEILKNYELYNEEYSDSNSLLWFSESDNGVYDAMNKGISLATGEYILFLNSGDYFVDNMVVEDFEALSTNSDIIAGYVIEEGTDRRIIAPINNTFKDFYKKNIPHQAEFIKKSLFKEIGFYDLKYKILADYDFNLRVLLNNKSYCLIDRCISIVEPNGLSCSSKNVLKIQQEYEKIISSHIPLIIKYDYDEYHVNIKKHSLIKWILSNRYIYIINKVLYNIYKFIKND